MNQRDEGHRLIRGRMAALGSAKTGAHVRTVTFL